MTLPQILSSSATKWAVGGWSFFIAENVILSENRTYLIHNFGEDKYRMAYGTCSTVAMGSILYGYFYKVKDMSPYRFSKSIPTSMKIGAFMVQGLGAFMVSQMFPKFQIPVHLTNDKHDTSIENGSNISTASVSSDPTSSSATTNNNKQWVVRCPFDFSADKEPEPTMESTTNTPQPYIYQPRGVERITRHPGLWSMGLLGCGNALITASIPQALWLSMPMMVAILGGAHQDSRHARGIGGDDGDNNNSDTNLALTKTEMKLQKTSHVPFYAMLMGYQDSDSLEQFWKDEIKGLNGAFALGMVGLWVARRGRGGASSLLQNRTMYERIPRPAVNA